MRDFKVLLLLTITSLPAILASFISVKIAPGSGSSPRSAHELLARDRNKVFDFYGEVFGWQKNADEADPTDFYQLFPAGGQTIGGMLTKLPSVPQPCWLYYLNVARLCRESPALSWNGEILAHPTRFERVTFAFGARNSGLRSLSSSPS